jgi:hypothetical protein
MMGHRRLVLLGKRVYLFLLETSQGLAALVLLLVEVLVSYGVSFWVSLGLGLGR